MFNWDDIGGFFYDMTDSIVDLVGAPIAAVAFQAAKGAVVGSVIGAAQSAISGGDIKRGALRGAAAGGVMAGTVSSLGQMFGGDQYSAENQLDRMSFTRPKTTSENSWGYSSPDSVVPDPKPKVSRKGLLEGGEEDSWWKKDSDGGKIVAGILGGAAAGYGNYMVAQKQADAEREMFDKRAAHEKELLERKNEMELERQEVTPVTGYQKLNMDYRLTDWWNKRMQERSA